MSTTIRVSERIKELLEALKPDAETFNEVVYRRASEKRSIEIGAWSDNEADRARDAVRRSWERFERRRVSVPRRSTTRCTVSSGRSDSSTGGELAVADARFETRQLEAQLAVTNLVDR